MKTYIPFFTCALTSFASLALALPVFPPRSATRNPSSRSLTTALLLNAPAFQDPSNPSNTIGAFESFVFLSQPDLSGITGLINSTLSSLGLNEGDKLTTAVDRLKLFAAVGVPGGDAQVELPGTGLKDLGIVSANVSIGACVGGSSTRSSSGNSTNLFATVTDRDPDTDSPTATVFFSPPSGFGIISDIDDTIKVSDVLNTSLLIQNTLFNDPVPVSGMPELYDSLASSLISDENTAPQFIYLSGSPIQLYPFLTSFIQSTFSTTSQGPLLLQNFSVTDPTLIINAITGSEDGGQGKIDYKVGQINNIHGMYPQKSFLVIGDSTEKDPEVYGLSFNIHGPSFIQCIWIHVVDGANNTDARFSAAFEGVPQDKIRLYRDEDIEGLRDVDVKGGSC
ncbi:hypothetical protein D9757_001013 [Collybiopsis confluens]|uniref:Phosphatidate phosphatase APP1 catalytic domain-containing protein n=1 Tax=Collybiopsis confluens TaxID=2823264 RepID=A0A8H5I0C2_9AGAR|nr:hypothetical protein D9757_001013 [Collybiopsis confluens]